MQRPDQTREIAIPLLEHTEWQIHSKKAVTINDYICINTLVGKGIRKVKLRKVKKNVNMRQENVLCNSQFY